MNSVKNIEELREMAWAFRASRVLQLAHKLDIFTLLSKAPLSALEIAKKCESNAEMTEKLLVACAALGLLQFRERKYENSELANSYLVRGKPAYQGNWIDHAADDLWSYWGEDIEKDLGGRHAGEKNSHRRFIMAMHDMAMGGEAEELAAHIDLKGRKLLFDVGGGPGTYAIFLCKNNPELRATVFDLPETIKITREVIKEFGMSGRISTMAGDWNRDNFGSGNDIVLMSNILHGPGSDAEMKLKKAFDSMNKEGLLIIRDFVLNNDKTGPVSAALFNLMLGAYTLGEISELIRESGFKNVRELEIPHKAHSIILAEKL